jgi:hypothetical protein
MFLYIHVMACIWYLVVDIDEKWIANKDFIWFGSPQVYDIFYTHLERQYWTSFYTAYFLFGVGEVTPRTQTEVIVAIPILIISSIMNGLIIGNMALYISELNKKRAEFQRKMDTVNTAMNNLNLSSSLRRDVNEFFIQTNSTSTLQNELDDFMRKRISQTYRIICSIQIFKNAVKTNIITSKLMNTNNEGEVINNIVKKMDTILKTPESILCKQNEEVTKENNDIYFIAKGKCNVSVKDKFSKRSEEKIVKILEPGSHFGEISVLYNCNRSATVEASYYLTCAKISHQNYGELLQNYPSLNTLFKQQIVFY